MKAEWESWKEKEARGSNPPVITAAKLPGGNPHSLAHAELQSELARMAVRKARKIGEWAARRWAERAGVPRALVELAFLLDTERKIRAVLGGEPK